MQITDHFDTREFACQCGECGETGEGISRLLVYTLEDIRRQFGKPMIVTSGIRCPQHNEKVGGANHSRHLPRTADAADIRVDSDDDRFILEKLAKDKGCSVGVADNFIHIDVRPGKPVYWTY